MAATCAHLEPDRYIMQDFEGALAANQRAKSLMSPRSPMLKLCIDRETRIRLNMQDFAGTEACARQTLSAARKHSSAQLNLAIALLHQDKDELAQQELAALGKMLPEPLSIAYLEKLFSGLFYGGASKQMLREALIKLGLE